MINKRLSIKKKWSCNQCQLFPSLASCPLSMMFTTVLPQSGYGPQSHFFLLLKSAKKNLRLFGYSLGPGGLVLHIMVTTVTRAAVTSLPLPSYPIKDAKGILCKIELGQSKMVAFDKINSSRHWGKGTLSRATGWIIIDATLPRYNKMFKVSVL